MAQTRFTAMLEDASNGFVCLYLTLSSSEWLGQRGRVPVAGTLTD